MSPTSIDKFNFESRRYKNLYVLDCHKSIGIVGLNVYTRKHQT